MPVQFTAAVVERSQGTAPVAPAPSPAAYSASNPESGMQYDDQSRSRPAPKGTCPVCSAHWLPNQAVGRTAERCHGCGTGIAHGKAVRRCAGLATHMRCLACAAKSTGASTTNQPVPSHCDGDGGVGEQVPPATAQSLADILPLLRQLPAAWPAQPLHWVPRALRSAAGQVLCAVLNDAITALAAELGNLDAEAATLLCRNVGMLLFRASPNDYDSEEVRPAGMATATVRRRVHAAAAGQWSGILQECLNELSELDERSARTKPSVSGSPPFPHPDTPLDDATLDRAAAKARLGGLRSAANILIGGPAVPLGPETNAKIHSLFKMAQDQSAEEQQRLEDSLRMAHQLPPKVRPIIRPRAASRIVSHLRASAGLGFSGVRNSYIQLII